MDVPKTRRNHRNQTNVEKNRWSPRTTVGQASVPPAIVLTAVSWCALRYLVQPQFRPDEYYIDEEFHVPQARNYCQAAFRKWDPKITTLPGLYLLSAAILVPFTKIYNIIFSFLSILENYDYEPCSLLALRAVNAVGAPLCLYFAYLYCQILLSQNENKAGRHIEWSYIVSALSVATFPVIYAPYSMLYYTDAWATASVFMWYSSHLSKNRNVWRTMVLGGFCVLCRQTNVAWLVFATIKDMCDCAEQVFPALKRNVQTTTFSYTMAFATELFHIVTRQNKTTYQKLGVLTKKCWHATKPNIIVIGLFAMFVVLLNNGDIVVGDRQAHIPSFHPMQMCYFMVFVLAFFSPWFLSLMCSKLLESKSVGKQQTQEESSNYALFVLMTAIISTLVYQNTIAHPYLLADNRHYTFYAWRLLFGPGKSTFLRYLPVPVYVYGLHLVNKTLTQTSIPHKLAFWVVTPLVLCLQFLLEPRYFVVPYLMFRLHCHINNTDRYKFRAAVVEFISYQVCNCIVMWIFLYRPFISTMDNTGRLDRFTW